MKTCIVFFFPVFAGTMHDMQTKSIYTLLHSATSGQKFHRVPLIFLKTFLCFPAFIFSPTTFFCLYINIQGESCKKRPVLVH